MTRVIFAPRAVRAAFGRMRKATPPRVVVFAACVLGGLVALYYVGMNVFVATRLFRNAIGYDPGSLLVEYDRAYSAVPGKIHVEGLRIRGRDSNVEWILAIDRCDFRVSFTDLLRRRFHASHVEGDGLTLRLRRRKDEVTPEAMSATPRIPGFLDPPLSDVGPPLTPLTDANYHLWSIWLDGVHASHVREIWIDTVRYTGGLTIAGSWFFRPMRWLDVGPATIELHPLDVSFGDVEDWVSGASGALEVTLAPTDLVATPAADIVGHVSLRGDVEGDAEIDRIASRIFDGMKWSPSVARFDARLDLDHGVVSAPTRVTLAPFAVRVAGDGYSAETKLRVEVDVDGGSASAHLDAAAVGIQRGGSPFVRASRVAARATTRALDLTHLPSGSPLQAFDALAVEAPDVDVPSLRTLAAPVRLPNGLSIEEGTGHVDVAVELDGARGTGRGHADVEARGLRARFVGEAIAGDARLALRAAAKAGVVDLSGTSLTFHADPASAREPWWGGVELTEATVRGWQTPRLQARIALHAKDASPLAALVVRKTPIPKLAVDAVSTADFQATADVVLSPSLVEARSVLAHCAGLDGRFEYVLRGVDAGWAIWLDLGMVRASAYAQNGSTEVTLFDTEPWFVQRVARLRAVE
jgi:hypothetical protein